MNLDDFIVEQVSGLVDGAEHNAAFLSVSVLTTAPTFSQDSSIALHRSPGTLAPGARSQGVAQAGRISRCANQSG
jgi:hypothetical protein